MTTRVHRFLGIVVALLVAGVGTATALEVGEGSPATQRPHRVTASSPSVPSSGGAGAPIRARRLLGVSVRKRPITLTEVGNSSSRRRVLVVGCIHGNEPAGIAVARDLETDPISRRVLLWVIADLNPDGVAAGTRQNANGVDLNRNFPWRWTGIGRPGDLHYSGPHTLSEPESRIARRFILRVRPHVTIWFHQHADVVDESGGSLRIERRYAQLTHMRLARLPRYPGSAAGWQNHRLPHTTAMVVELPAGSLSQDGVERFSDGILRLLN
ncbi:MAG: DUF2817 domain-containing protein [Actinomycetota bacterium]|nr:DUF2817 domain-containing protein [Actinomycetota bacterium]